MVFASNFLEKQKAGSLSTPISNISTESGGRRNYLKGREKNAMTQSRWEPFGSMWKEMNRLQREMNHLFGSYGAGGDGWPTFAAVSFPAFNIWQDESSVYAEAELPGLELNDLEIYVTAGNQLTIKG